MFVRVSVSFLMGAWAGVYTGSLALGLWRRENRRGAVMAAGLAVLSLGMPLGVEWYLGQ